MPVARKLWQLIFVWMPAATARRWIIMWTFAGESGAGCQLAVPKRGEEGSSGFASASPEADEPFIEKLFKVVVAGELVDLAAFFVEPNPSAALLDVVVLDFHRDGRAHARERVAHEPNERAIAKTDQTCSVSMDCEKQLPSPRRTGPRSCLSSRCAADRERSERG